MARVSIYPPYNLEDALIIAKTIWKDNAGKPMRRLIIFNTLKRSPSSGKSRQLVTASSSYGLTQGSYSAEHINLTDRGRSIVEKNDAQSKIDAVLSIKIFNLFFENYCDSSVPSETAAKDFLKTNGIPEKGLQKCFEVLLSCGEQVELIQEISGVKRIVSKDFALEKLKHFEQITDKIQNDLLKEKTEQTEEKNNKEKGLLSGHFPQHPSIHIDIQIHIAADTKPEQIDQIFACMAKYLYKKE